MTNEQILAKATQKAIDGGWNMFGYENYRVLDGCYPDFWTEHKNGRNSYLPQYQTVIFNHDFAKALWGEKPENNLFGVPGILMWGYRLQQMVIAEDPIKYLGENL